MESFPHGLHMRLENRGSNGHLHADKDDTTVSCRRNWSRALTHTEWVASRSVREGKSYVLLQSVFNGGFLAARLKRSRRGRFVHIKHCETGEVDSCAMWEVFKAPGGGDDVLLQNKSPRCFLSTVSNDPLRVTALEYDGKNRTLETQRHWTVIEVLPSPGPTEAIVRQRAIVKFAERCISCDRAISDGKLLCMCCVAKLQKLLDSIRGKWTEDNLCLVCAKLVGKHSEHNSKTIVIQFIHGKLLAHCTGKEIWAGVFSGIQSDTFGHSLLHTPQRIRCLVCNDLLEREGLWLFEPPYHFCTLQCMVKFGGSPATAELAKKMLEIDFKSEVNSFCTECEVGFNHLKDNKHSFTSVA